MTETGQQLPDYTLHSTNGPIKLGQENGNNIILVFYPEDDTPVCSSQLSLYNEVLPMFERYDAKIYGISTDNIASHEKFSKQLNLKFPLLSDDNPDGELSRLLGVYNPKSKKSQRAIFVLDKTNTIRWKHISPEHINPGADGILKSLESINP